MTRGATIVWFRLDLRLQDNPALTAALERGGAVIPVFIWAPSDEEPWAPGAASNWWIAQSLRRLSESLEAKGSRLVVRRGGVLETLRELIRATGASAVHWNRRYEPRVVERDGIVEQALRKDGVEVGTFNAALLFEPREIATKVGGPFKVFTPFYNACLRMPPSLKPRRAPRDVPAPSRWPRSENVASLGLEPEVDWAAGLRAAWTPGENGAAGALERLLDDVVESYPAGRDRPDIEGTSRLSPHLHFGEIGPRAVWSAVNAYAGVGAGNALSKGGEAYLRQLVWREFAHHLLFHFPHTADRPLRPEFERFPWRRDAKALEAWRKGRTGYPMVDAGMRQLWTTGWMHNRVRMIVASFLVKDLLLPWQEGARWFWDTLVDADLANNTLGWQWTAGCGADAAPYFRVFNPVAQGERYDPEGEYVRRHVPELAALPARFVHAPWKAPAGTPAAVAVGIGESYPRPIVDHGAARTAALAAYGRIKKSR